MTHKLRWSFAALVTLLSLVLSTAAAGSAGPAPLAAPDALGSNYRWHTFYGSSSDDYGHAVAIDESGNIYVTGPSSHPWQGDGGANPLHPFTSGGTTVNRDIFVLKLDSGGAYQWHTFYGSTDSDEGYDIAVDENGNIYVTGYSYSSWQGDGSAEPLHPISRRDIFVLKLDSSGAYQWHTFYGAFSSTANDLGSGIAFDAEGSVYVAGRSAASWLGDVDAAPLHAHSGNQNLAVLKLTGSGTYQWHTFYGSDAQGNGIALDGDGNPYVVGASYYSWLGDGGAAPLHPFAPGGNWDLFVLKLTGGGAYQWHTFYGSTASGMEDGRGIALDGSGNVYAAGITRDWQGPGGEAPLHPFTGSADTAVLKLDSNGAYQWHTFYGPDSFSLDDTGHQVAVDKSGNLYVAGAAGSALLKLAANGSLRWQVDYDGFASSGVEPDQGSGVYVAGTGGFFQGPDGQNPLHAVSSLYDIAIVALVRVDIVHFDPAGNCCGQEPCYTTLAEALANLWPGDILYIYPGTYPESLDLAGMALPGDLHVITVDANGTPTPGTATIAPPSGPALNTSTRLPGDLSIDGLVVLAADDDGVQVAATGDISVVNVVANDCGGDGLDLDAGGSVTVDQGSTANGNGESGVQVVAGDDVLIRRVTARDNALAGIEVAAAGGTVTVLDCWLSGNDGQGLALGAVAGAATLGGSLVCANGTGLEVTTTIAATAEANWWGCAGGPGTAGCDTIVPGPATVDVTPWIATAEGSATLDPVVVGQPAAVQFQFSGGSGTVFLGQGPGDPNGSPPFTVSTDNGTLAASTGTGASVGEFVNRPDGVLEVMLVAGRGGTATVTLAGPCGLDNSTAVRAVYHVYLPLVVHNE